jgi:hypothetical protein
MSNFDLKIAEGQYKLALEYNRLINIDYDSILVNYIDLKDNDIWSYELLRKVKMDFK